MKITLFIVCLIKVLYVCNYLVLKKMNKNLL